MKHVFIVRAENERRIEYFTRAPIRSALVAAWYVWTALRRGAFKVVQVEIEVKP